MKPDNAKTLNTDMDLSECAVEAALEIISKKLPKTMSYGWLSLPSQSLGTAVLLTKYNNFIELSYPNIHLSIEINSTYYCDEWSVTVNNWDFSGKNSENNPITVWNAGA